MHGCQPGIETAIVLPDENLLVPLLHSVHGVNDLNVTLGYPLRSSGIVSLMHIVARMHHQASKEVACGLIIVRISTAFCPIRSSRLTSLKRHWPWHAGWRRQTVSGYPRQSLRMSSFKSLFEPAVNSDAGIQ